jgi:hypothetical protein
MPLVPANSTANPVRRRRLSELQARARLLLQAEVAAAWAMALLMVVSLATFVPGHGAYTFVAIATALGAVFANLLLLAQAGSPRLKMNVIGGIPLAAGLAGKDVAGVLRGSRWPTRLSSLTCAAVVATVVFASGLDHFFPSGDAEVRNGAYVEVSHGSVLRTLSRADFERVQMDNLRFALTIAVAIQLMGALLTSGAANSELRRDG